MRYHLTTAAAIGSLAFVGLTGCGLKREPVVIYEPNYSYLRGANALDDFNAREDGSTLAASSSDSYAHDDRRTSETAR